MNTRIRAFVATIFVMGSFPAVAHAGMPSFTLTDVARMRVQTLSFFLLVFFLSSWFLQRIWNYLARDFTRLPLLSYGKALGVVTLWGLLFVIVLTMISGARELMTPGAWEKQGLTYRLAKEAKPETNDDVLENARRQKLEVLRACLKTYAQSHGGKFPADANLPEIPSEFWQVPDASGMRYLYIGGQAQGKEGKPLAYEPELFGPKRMVLFTDGEVKLLDWLEIAPLLVREPK